MNSTVNEEQFPEIKNNPYSEEVSINTNIKVKIHQNISDYKNLEKSFQN